MSNDSECSGWHATIFSGPDDPDHVVGTEGEDVILARGSRKIVEGLGGNDVICVNFSGAFEEAGIEVDGGPGNDYVWLTSWGQDVVRGGSGHDEIFGNTGSDHIDGGDGDDFIHAGGGNDHLYGGAGNDRINGGPHEDVINGGPGDDRCDGDLGYDEASNCEKVEEIP